MPSFELEIMPDASEVIHYDQAGIPLYIRGGRLSLYPEMKAECHWHEDLEFIRVLEGRMDYSIDGKRVILEEGDLLFVNSKHLHYGYDHLRNECLFICILFHPCLAGPTPAMFKEYMEPVIGCEALPYLHLKPSDKDYPAVLQALDGAWNQKQFGGDAYQLLAFGQLLKIMPILLKRAKQLNLQEISIRQDPKLYAQKQMVAYIAQNYMMDLSLEDIAGAANVSVSTCCRIFKNYIHQSPIEFLNSYRLKISCNLLTETSQSITEIATTCGFNHTSYFSEIFLRYYGCTPTQYRKLNQH